MANRKSVGPAGPGEVKAAWFMPEQLARVPIGELVPYARNARTHSESQIAQIRASLREFGFVNPVIIDSDRNIIAGHGRVLAAQAGARVQVVDVGIDADPLPGLINLKVARGSGNIARTAAMSRQQAETVLAQLRRKQSSTLS